MRRLVFWPPKPVTASTHAPTRLWEIDTLRGIAVVLMVFYHGVWDLSYFGIASIDITSAPWQYFARSIGTMFITLLGISLALTSTRQSLSGSKRQAISGLWKHSLMRGGTLFGLGLAITLVTYVVIGAAYVRFGILHLLGLTLILATPFVYVRSWINLVVGVVLIGIGTYLNTLALPVPWLIWLGVPQVGVAMVDYYPLLPWFGIALLGIAAGSIGYPQGQRRFVLPDLASFPPIRGLQFLGRHSLMIYLIHQPALVGVLIGLRLGSL